MRWMKAMYGAAAVGAAAAAVGSPIIVRKFSEVWPIVGGDAASAAKAPPVAAQAAAIPSDPAPASRRMSPATPGAVSPGASTGSSPTAAAARAGGSTAIEPAADRPGFDVVRVDPSGEAVVAGHAAPGAAVELRDGGRVIAEVDADASGQFVVLPPPLSPGAHSLDLSARRGGAPAIASDPLTLDLDGKKPESSGPRAPAVAEALQGRAPSAPGARAAPAADRAGPVREAGRSPALPPSSPPVSPTDREKPGAALETAAASPKPSIQAASPGRDVPPPPPPRPATESAIAGEIVAPRLSAEAAPRVSVRTVEAPGGGRLEVKGVADPNAPLRFYLNGSALADATAGLDRRWSLTIEHGVSPGFYTFRADEMDRANGAVSARAETPFSYPKRTPPPTVESQATSSSAAAPARSPAFSVAAGNETKPAVLGVLPPPAGASPTASAPASPSQQVASARSPADVVIADVQITTVAAGDNLWDLARRFYGDGMRFHDIYAANAWQIREPRLIFIGQKFVVPKQLQH